LTEPQSLAHCHTLRLGILTIAHLYTAVCAGYPVRAAAPSARAKLAEKDRALAPRRTIGGHIFAVTNES